MASAPKVSVRARATWSSNTDAMLISVLESEKSDGRMTSNSSWHKDVWPAAEKALADTEMADGGTKKTASACQSRWGNLKGMYAEIRTLLDKSGWGWDDEKQMVVADDAVWEPLIESKAALAKWKSKTFPLYNRIHEICCGTIATGGRAFRPGRDFSPPSSPPRGSSPIRSHSPGPVRGSDDVSETEETPISKFRLAVPHAPLARKRSALDLSSEGDSLPEPSSSVKRSKSKHTNQQTMLNVASSLQQLTAHIAGPSSAPVGISKATPERASAIRLLEDDGDLSDSETIKAIKLFTKNSQVAQSYISIKKKSTRTAYIQSEMDDVFGNK